MGQMLRPRWLEMRDPLPAMPSAALVNPPVVYVDGVSMGGADFLSTMPVEAVLEMRWLSSNEAAARLGTRDGLTAIIVTLIQRISDRKSTRLNSIHGYIPHAA